MSTARWDQVKSLFHAAMELPAPERGAFLETQCKGDAALRQEVDSLLAARTQEFVRTGGAAHALGLDDVGGLKDNGNTRSTMTHFAPITETPGTVIGPYKLLQVIGEGGFGTVFLAEQHQPVRRRVALKIIKLGMDTKSVVARFEAERQALALMEHPHIARVLDGGATDTGRPYFVMEYVVGDSITKFADAHSLTVNERLDLFQQVCSAVQHAHTKGIIHRDLKPGNVLVSMVDGKPFAKVIDFGIAKATAGVGGALTDKTLFTEHKLLIGTPEYMSPEQAEGSMDIDTRTDVYSLGVLLYELLTGTTPIDSTKLRSAAYDEMRRMIREDDPPMPSMKLSRSLDKLAATAAARKVEPARLSTIVKGELDWIVMKALEKERGRRYETANALGDDVRRHLLGEAVIAAPVSRAYRLSKFVRKNKGLVAAVSAVGATLLIGVAGTAWGLWNAEIANSSLRAQVAMVRVEAQKLGSDAVGGVWSDTSAYPPFNSDGFVDGPRGPQALYVELGDKGEVITWGLRAVQPDDLQFESQFNSLVGIGRRSILALRERSSDLQATNAALQAQTGAAEWSAYTANLALAQATITGKDFPEARRILERVPASRRGWEYRFLDLQARAVIICVDGVGERADAWLDESGRLSVQPLSGGSSVQTWSLDKADGWRLRPLTATDAEIRDRTNASSVSVIGSAIQKLGQHSAADTKADVHLDCRVAHAYWNGTNRSYLIEAPQSQPLRWRSPLIPFKVSDHEHLVGMVLPWGRNSGDLAVLSLDQLGGPEYHDPDHTELFVASILASFPSGPSGLALTTPDGSRRIVGAADKTVRFYEAKEGLPTLPTTMDAPDGVYREVAVFRMDDAVTNLQMTGDGTRLIISLADGSARVWDIRDPAERRKDLEREWAERVPAGEYLDGLWNTAPETLPTDSIREKIIADASGSLTPLRRLVAVEMLEERIEATQLTANEVMASIQRRAEVETNAWQAIDTVRMKSSITAAANEVTLPPRVKELVVAWAKVWQYTSSSSDGETRLKDETRKKEIAEATLWFERFMHGEITSPSEQIAALSNVLRLRQQNAPSSDDGVIQAMWALGCVRFMNDPSGVLSLDMMRDAARKYEANHSEPSATLIAMYNNLAGAELSTGNYEAAEAVGEKLIKAWRVLGHAPSRIALDAPFTPFNAHYIGSVYIPWESEPEFEKAQSRLESLHGDSLKKASLEDLASKVRRRFTLTRSADEQEATSAIAWMKLRVLPVLEPQNASLEARSVLAMAHYALEDFDAAIHDLDGSASTPENVVIRAAAQYRSGRVNEARESLAKAKVLMEPAADGTPSPWADDADAKALLAEAEALIGK